MRDTGVIFAGEMRSYVDGAQSLVLLALLLLSSQRNKWQCVHSAIECVASNARIETSMQPAMQAKHVREQV